MEREKRLAAYKKVKTLLTLQAALAEYDTTVADRYDEMIGQLQQLQGKMQGLADAAATLKALKSIPK